MFNSFFIRQLLYEFVGLETIFGNAMMSGIALLTISKYFDQTVQHEGWSGSLWSHMR